MKLGGEFWPRKRAFFNEGPKINSVADKFMKNIKILLAGVVAAWLFIDTSSFAADKPPTNQSTSTESIKAPPTARTIKLDGTYVDLDRLEKESQRLPSSSLGDVIRREKDQSGNEAEVRYNRRAQYFPRNNHIAMIESKILSDEISQGHLKVYRDDGTKVFERKLDPDKDGDYLDYEDVRVLGNHHVITIASKYIGENKSQLDIYNIDSNTVIFSTPSNHLRNFQISPDESYILLNYADEKKQGSIYKYTFKNSGVQKLDGATLLDFSGDGKSYVLAGWEKTGKNQVSGNELGTATLYFYKGDKLIWTNKTKQYEISMGGGWDEYSKNNKYYIYSRNVDVTLKENRLESYKTEYYIFDTSDGRIVTEGQLLPETVERYKQEMILGGDKK